MDKAQINSWLKKETLIVALATALCYTGAYVYERGFAVYFGIPTELISVTPGSIITTVSLFVGFLFLVYILSTFPVLISQSKKIRNNFIIITLSLSPVWILFNLIFFLISGFKTLNFSIVTMGFLLLCGSIFLSKKQLNNRPKLYSLETSKGIFNSIDNAAGLIFWFSFTFFSIISGMGTFIARTTDNFSTFTYKNENYKLIKSYGDNIIAIKETAKKNEDGVYIFKAEDLKETLINKVKA
ncbi:TPA: hypothetical protein ACS3VG_004544 [Klebsiella aerogenes]|uniref:hypothetical protein n=2 Tax=Klebsiella aerogenes TaxID=548 RepID=UPI00044836CB|nr:hypothetical protein [Klebsiella aerogenes]EIV6705552.1 hypothetical protein [Klebsiella aerogenes]EIV9530460.1 hypothetical protein [Klebsiella aerogenes]EKU8837616.1 hypothetical protein [Klebsiella aerogenes]EKV6366969.1 hypothetical protein [Klebsiella aerogenes]EKW2819252.1 hypothetical protein [Klebsiella aerogenes]